MSNSRSLKSKWPPAFEILHQKCFPVSFAHGESIWGRKIGVMYIVSGVVFFIMNLVLDYNVCDLHGHGLHRYTECEF